MINKKPFFFTVFLALFISGGSLFAQESASIYAGIPFLEGSRSLPYSAADGYEANLSISHGHCQLPIELRFSKVDISYSNRGLDDLRISFALSAHSLVAAGEPAGEWTQKMKAPGSFDARNHPNLKFECTSSHHIGTNWYEIVGNMRIKGKSVPARFHVRPIYEGGGCNSILKKFVVTGELDPDDFGIDEANVGGPEAPKHRMYVSLLLNAQDGC